MTLPVFILTFKLTFSVSALRGAGDAAGALLHSIGSGRTDSDSAVGCSGSSPGGFGTTIFSLSARELSTGPVTPGTSSACSKTVVRWEMDNTWILNQHYTDLSKINQYLAYKLAQVANNRECCTQNMCWHDKIIAFMLAIGTLSASLWFRV